MVAGFLLALTSPIVAEHAYAQTCTPGTTSPICDAKGVITFFNNVSAWLATIFWIVAVIAGFYAGFLYLTANGDETKITKAHKQLLYTVIAIAVGLMVYGLPSLVKSILGGT